MTIQETINGKNLELKVAGRLDTTTAPDLDKKINDLIYDVEKLTFDFSDLIYISSAGLRVLLSAQKKMSRQGEMVIRGVSADIMEIFEVTGFSDILTIE